MESLNTSLLSCHGDRECARYIPKRRQREIAERLEIQAARRVFEDFWNALTPEQREKEIAALRRKAEQARRDLDLYKWRDNIASTLRQAERIGDIGQIGYLRTSRKSYFEKVQRTLNMLEKLIETGKEKGWNVDYPIRKTEERLKNILNERRSGDF